MKGFLVVVVVAIVEEAAGVVFVTSDATLVGTCDDDTCHVGWRSFTCGIVLATNLRGVEINCCVVQVVEVWVGVLHIPLN